MNKKIFNDMGHKKASRLRGIFMKVTCQISM